MMLTTGDEYVEAVKYLIETLQVNVDAGYEYRFFRTADRPTTIRLYRTKIESAIDGIPFGVPFVEISKPGPNSVGVEVLVGFGKNSGLTAQAPGRAYTGLGRSTMALEIANFLITGNYPASHPVMGSGKPPTIH